MYFKLTWLMLFFSSFLDLYLASDIYGIRSTRIYHKRENFHFKLEIFPALAALYHLHLHTFPNSFGIKDFIKRQQLRLYKTSTVYKKIVNE